MVSGVWLFGVPIFNDEEEVIPQCYQFIFLEIELVQTKRIGNNIFGIVGLRGEG
jgi:hypothetical protein